MSMLEWRSASAVVCLALASFARPASAQCAEWARTFAPPGLDGNVHALRVLDDGSGPALYASGLFSGSGRWLSRWDGARWSGLAIDPPEPVQALAVFDDGTGRALYAASLPSLLRFDGSTWFTIGTVSGSIQALAAFDDGRGAKLYVAGAFTAVDGESASNIACWDGASWSALAGGVSAGSSFTMVETLAVHDEGAGPSLFVAGSFEKAGGVPASNLARWDGSSWHALASGAVVATSVRLQECAPAGGGAPDLYAMGAFQNGPAFVHGVARRDGGSWSLLGSGPGGYVAALARLGDALYAAGSFFAGGLAKWNGSAWTPIESEIGVDGFGSGQLLAIAAHDDGHGARLFVGGDFDSFGGVRAANVATWNGSACSATVRGAPLDGPVHALAAFDDGEGEALFAAGSFAHAGGVSVTGVAKWNGVRWSSAGELVGFVSALQVFDDGSGAALYAGGTLFESEDSHPFGVAMWEDSIWWPLPDGPEFGVRALAVFDDGAAPALYVGGYFASAGGVDARGVARWDGNAWSALGGGIDGEVLALAVFDVGDGAALYAGGAFASAGGVDARGVARWDGASWSALGGGVDGVVNALAVFDDGTGSALYAAGDFHVAGDALARNIARWDGTTWSALDTGVHGSVTVLGTFDDGTGRGESLYAGGQFESAGGVASRGIARWDGSRWCAMGAGFQPSSSQQSAARVTSLAVYDDAVSAGADLFVGSSYVVGPELARYVADASPSAATRFLARWNGCGQTGALFCFGDGSGSACPCENSTAEEERAGCASSIGVGATLRASGAASLAHDALTLRGDALPPSSVALYFQGTGMRSAGMGIAHEDGLMCLDGALVRLAVLPSAGGSSRFPSEAGKHVSSAGAIESPGTRTYQVLYRDAPQFCTSARFNLSNALRIRWAP